MKLPSKEQIIELHKELASNDKELKVIYMHSEIIWEICQEIIQAKQLNVDVELVKTGAFVHDIGVYEVGDAQYVTHGILGYNILKERGFNEVICRFAAHHTGMGISRQQIAERGIDIPEGDYFAETLEEEIIMYADKFHSKTEPPVFNSYAWYLDHVSQFGEDSRTKFEEMRHKFGLPNLNKLAKKHKQIIRNIVI